MFQVTMNDLLPNQTRIDAAKPTFIGFSGPYMFYEHPVHGDEAPLMIRLNGNWFNSGFWELPDPSELD